MNRRRQGELPKLKGYYPYLEPFRGLSSASHKTLLYQRRVEKVPETAGTNCCNHDNSTHYCRRTVMNEDIDANKLLLAQYDQLIHNGVTWKADIRMLDSAFRGASLIGIVVILVIFSKSPRSV